MLAALSPLQAINRSMEKWPQFALLHKLTQAAIFNFFSCFIILDFFLVGWRRNIFCLRIVPLPQPYETLERGMFQGVNSFKKLFLLATACWEPSISRSKHFRCDYFRCCTRIRKKNYFAFLTFYGANTRESNYTAREGRPWVKWAKFVSYRQLEQNCVISDRTMLDRGPVSIRMWSNVN